MLIRITNNQLNNFWPEIRETIFESQEASLTEEHLSNIQRALLEGKMQAWVALSNNDKLLSILLTTISIDSGPKRKSLVIYGMKAFTPAKTEEWGRWLETIRAFAQSAGCAEIITATKSQSVVRRATNGLGGTADYRLVRFPITKGDT